MELDFYVSVENEAVQVKKYSIIVFPPINNFKGNHDFQEVDAIFRMQNYQVIANGTR